MIPVYQTRTAPDGPGNCFEACLASILELPLSTIPDRRDFLDPPEWKRAVDAAREHGGEQAVGDLELPGQEVWGKTLDRWLGDRGLGLLELECDDRKTRAAVVSFLEEIPGYWIAVHRSSDTAAHAVVRCGGGVAHNPHRGYLEDELLGELITAWILVAADPPKIARRLGPEALPDIAGELAAAHALTEEEALAKIGRAIENAPAELRAVPDIVADMGEAIDDLERRRRDRGDRPTVPA